MVRNYIGGNRIRYFLCGIYIILHKKTKKWYVGQAEDIHKRWSVHKTNLKDGTHHCQHLQRMWNKYGEDAFLFKIVEECPKSMLNEREIYWYYKCPSTLIMNCHPPGKCARGFSLTDRTKAKMSISAKKASNTPEQKKMRSERAKAQHAAKNFGRHTWSDGTKFRTDSTTKNRRK
jgi:group I intron endonuclease